ncbi:O-antigen ligase, partial [Streptomyces sp. SM12]|uniref:O-antigen ligase family protein n=1 Tax=Streptomyces sp. SM12 TaxID=1071602 RepID=UPI002156628B
MPSPTMPSTTTASRPAPHGSAGPSARPEHPAPPERRRDRLASAVRGWPVRGWLVRNRALLPALATLSLLALPAGLLELGGGRLAVADIASGLLVAAALVALVRGDRPRLGGPAVLVFATAALALGVVTLVSADQTTALTGYVRYLQVFVLVPLSLLVLLRDRRDVRVVAGALVALAVLQGTVGIWQYVTGGGASYMGENIRAVGTFGPQNVMGMSTVVSYGLIVALCAALSPPANAPRWWRPAALACTGWLLAALAVSFSRGAWIAAALACAVVLLLSGCLTRRALVALGVFGLLLIGVAGAASGQLGDRLTSIGDVTGTPDQSVVDRYAMWEAARSMWWEEPWAGVGLKGFAEHRDAHASIALSGGSDTGGAGSEFQRQALESPHNMYLLVLSEQGLLGLTALAGGWAALLAGCLLRLNAARRAAEAA